MSGTYRKRGIMSAPVVINAVRTAVATSRKGSLANTSGEILVETILRAALERSGVDPLLVDDVVMAESGYGGGVLARYGAVKVGLMQAGGMAVNRHCAGSLSAIGVAAGAIISGMERLMIAGGVYAGSMGAKSLWRTPGTDDWAPRLPPTHPDIPGAPHDDMSITVGWNTAQAAGLTREDMDAWAVRSHHRAVAAIDAGNFKDEITPVDAVQPDGTTKVFEVDEHPRRDSSMEKMATLKILHPEIEGFSITAGNASGVNDAASALTLASAEFAKSEGHDPVARILGWTARGVNPFDTGLGAIEAIKKLLERTGRQVSDIALWEINEAFASVPVAACRMLNISEDLVNISGSGCSLGHPIAATGGRMLTTLINDLKRRGGGLGVAAMCAGGGQGGAMLIEV